MKILHFGILTQHGIIFSNAAIMNADYTNLNRPHLLDRINEI